MLRLSDLTFAYETTPVLSDVSFTVEAGKFAALLGPNGAGKSTLIALITRQLRAPAGTVFVDGHDVAKRGNTALASLGIVFQSSTLDLDLTVDQNLSYFGGLHGMSPRQSKQRAEPWLEQFDLAARRAEKVRVLSGGQRRRVEITRALLHNPKLLVLDEPTTGLDVPTRLSIVDQIHTLSADHGLSVLWATHLVDEVRESDDLVVLRKGRIDDAGPSKDVVARRGVDSLEQLAGGTGNAPQTTRATP